MIVDLTHEVSPQNVEEGAFHLWTAIDAFPAGAVHVAVVDPGVGTARKEIAVESGGQLFVGPDNGLFSLVLPDARRAVEIANREFMRDVVTDTFHGRDLFAPVGARLASGQCSLEDLGPAVAVDDLVKLQPTTSVGDRIVTGRIVSIDRFGNAITLIAGQQLCLDVGGTRKSVECGTFTVNAVHNTFGDVPIGEPVAYVGSSDTLELAVRNGSAADRYGLKPGDGVRVTFNRRRST